MRAPPHTSDLRKGRYSARGCVYLVTTRCRSGRIFSNPILGQIVVDEIIACDRTGQSKTLAHVVMPDHLHWLLQLKGDESLSRVVGRMKGRAAHRIGTTGLAINRVWQPGFHDRALRRDEDLQHAARYVVSNPVRAGLVAQYDLYHLSWCRWEV